MIELPTNRKFITVTFLLGLTISCFAQNDSIPISREPEVKKEADRNLKFNLNKDGSHWFHLSVLNQVWTRINESNPGTLQDGQPVQETFDIGLRRTRLQLLGQLTDRTFLYFQLGMNNVNAHSTIAGENNRKVQFFFHDALFEYNVFKQTNFLKLGAGLTIANGLSRFSQPGVSTIATLDVPVFLQATVDQIDQFSRKLSMYARGQVGKIDYRLVLSDPYPVSNSGGAVVFNLDQASFAGKGHYKQYQTYIAYQFFEHEPHTTPYMAGSYLGKKKVFNIAMGAIFQKNALWYNSGTTALKDTAYNDLALFGLESFFDSPLNSEKGTALNFFAGYYLLDYGKNYLRYNGIMNPVGTGSLANSTQNTFPASGGNAYPMFGTGKSFYAQAGYLFRKDLLGEHGTLQPFTSVHLAEYRALKETMIVFDAGVNWLLEGHKSKISFDYQLRPVYGQDKKVTERKSCFILQYQLFI